MKRIAWALVLLSVALGASSYVVTPSAVLVDTSANLQDAIYNLPAYGGKIVLGPGIFTVPSGGLVIDRPVEIAGAGGVGTTTNYGVTTLVPYSLAANQPVIRVVSGDAYTEKVESVYLHDFAINGGAPSPQATKAVLDSSYGIRITPSSTQIVRNVVLERVYVTHMSNSGLFVTGDGGQSSVVGLRVRDCTFTENWGDGLYVTGATLFTTQSVLSAANFRRGAYYGSVSPVSVGDYFEDNCHDSTLVAGYDGQMTLFSGTVHVTGAAFEAFNHYGATDSHPYYRQQRSTQAGIAAQSISGEISGCRFLNTEVTSAPNQYGIHVDNTNYNSTLRIGANRFDYINFAIVQTAGVQRNQTVEPQSIGAGTPSLSGVYGQAILMLPGAPVATPDTSDTAHLYWNKTKNRLMMWDPLYAKWDTVTTSH